MTRSFVATLLLAFLMFGNGCVTLWNGETTSQTEIGKAIADQIGKEKGQLTPEILRAIEAFAPNNNIKEYRVVAPVGAELKIEESAYGFRGSSLSYRQSYEEGARMARTMLIKKKSGL